MSLYLKITKTKKGWRCSSSAQCLTSKCEAQSSNPSTAKEKIFLKNIFGEKAD
jgi:hypothetical protein